MAYITAGSIRALYLFDVADEIDLGQLSALVQGGTATAKLEFKPTTPQYIQYQQPPLLFGADAVGAGDVEGFQVRFKVYDYGIVSVALSRAIDGDWPQLIDQAYALAEPCPLEKRAEQLCREFVDRVTGAVSDRRETFLTEDYLVFSVTTLDPKVSAAELIESHGDQIATLLRGERERLSDQEREDVLKHTISYLADDLFVPTWNAAFIYDTSTGVNAAVDLIEYANSVLLNFRYYDDLLDRELTRLYAALKRPRGIAFLNSRRYVKEAQRVQALLVDINELTDKSENALKIVGDVYAARMYALTAGRLGIASWKQSVEEKLGTLDDIYRFAVDLSQMARGHVLELTIVLILILELVLFFMGIMT